MVLRIEICPANRTPEINCETLILPAVFLNALITNSPLHETKAKAAKLTTKRINVKEAQEVFKFSVAAERVLRTRGNIWDK